MINDMFLPLTSFPVPTERRTIEMAVHLAEAFKARASALAFEMDIRSPVGLYADPLHVSSILAADSDKSAANARDLLDTFEAVATGGGIPHDHTLMRSTPRDIPERLADEARFHDISVVPLKNNDGLGQDLAERLIFESGHPVLLLPEGRPELSAVLENVAVAWDFSPPATRAVVDAMPFLQRAKQVRLVTIVDDKAMKRAATVDGLAKYLAGHGVKAILEEIKAGGRAIGDVLHSYVGEHNIDLLVMGGYGHSRIREFVLGGATKSVLTSPPTWTLMSH